MNKVIVLGNMTRDIEIQQGGEYSIGKFGIAVNEKFKTKETTHFFDVTCFGKTAENIQKYFSKGSRILVEGKLSYSQWEKDGQKRSKVEITMDKFDFIDRKTDEQQPRPQYQNPPEVTVQDEEIPF